jgi:hypothetical protein
MYNMDSYGSIPSSSLEDHVSYHQGLINFSSNVAVDTTGQLAMQEVDYVNHRADKVHACVQDYIGRTIQGDVEIDFIFSGGGYRAMIASTGFLLGALKSGLFGTATYISSLSGSTWCIATLLAKAYHQYKEDPDNFSLDEFFMNFVATLQERVDTPFWEVATLNKAAIIARLLEDIATYREVYASDLWGALLVDRLMGDISGVQNIMFSEVRYLLEHIEYFPFPIFSAAMTYLEPREWVEVNPYICGLDRLPSKTPGYYLPNFVPTPNFNGKFESGSSTVLYPEESLGSFLGVFGSAYSLTPADLLVQISRCLDNPTIDKLVQIIIDVYQEELNNLHILPGKFRNLTYKMEQSIVKDFDKLTWADAGVDFNLPFPPLLNRMLKDEAQGITKARIYMACDASGDSMTPDFSELRYAKDYATRQGFKFPPLDQYGVIDDNVFVFEDPTDPTIPTILYFRNPRTEYGMFKLEYSNAEFNDLCSCMMEMVANNKDAIATVIDRKTRAINGEEAGALSFDAMPVPSAPPFSEVVYPGYSINSNVVVYGDEEYEECNCCCFGWRRRRVYRTTYVPGHGHYERLD